MMLWKSKVWDPVDLVLFKWCCISFGIIVGAYMSSFVKENLWLFILAAILLAIKPVYSYYYKN